MPGLWACPCLNVRVSGARSGAPGAGAWPLVVSGSAEVRVPALVRRERMRLTLEGKDTPAAITTCRHCATPMYAVATTAGEDADADPGSDDNLWISRVALDNDAVNAAMRAPDYSPIFGIVLKAAAAPVQPETRVTSTKSVLAPLPHTMLSSAPPPGTAAAQADALALRYVAATRAAADKEICALIRKRQTEIDVLTAKASTEARALAATSTPEDPVSHEPKQREPSGLSASLKRNAGGPLAFVPQPDAHEAAQVSSAPVHPAPAPAEPARAAPQSDTASIESTHESIHSEAPVGEECPVFSIDEDVNLQDTKPPPLTDSADEPPRVERDPALAQLLTSGGSFSVIPKLHMPDAGPDSSVEQGPYDLAETSTPHAKPDPQTFAEEYARVGLTAPSHRSRTASLADADIPSVRTASHTAPKETSSVDREPKTSVPHNESMTVPPLHSGMRAREFAPGSVPSSSRTLGFNVRLPPPGFVPEVPVAPSANSRTSGVGRPRPLHYTDDMSRDPERDSVTFMHYLQNLKLVKRTGWYHHHVPAPESCVLADQYCRSHVPYGDPCYRRDV